MRALCVLVWLVACGRGMRPEPRMVAREELASAAADVARMTKMAAFGVVNGGLWFEDPACKFPVGEVHPSLLPDFARCLVGLKLQQSLRGDALGDVLVLTDALGFELEARVSVDRFTRVQLLWIGYASKGPDALPTISGTSLDALRVRGDHDGPIDPALGDTLDRAPFRSTGTRVDPKAMFAFAWLKLCLDATGAITAVEPLLTTSPDAQKAFIAAARAWEFKPFVVRGRPIPVCAVARLSYPPHGPNDEVLPLPPPPASNKKRPLVLATSKLLEGKRIAGTKAIVPEDTDKLYIQQKGIGPLVASFRVCIDEAGAVESVLPTRSSGLTSYDDKLLAGIRGWRYSPYMIDDQPVPVCAHVTFVYSQR